VNACVHVHVCVHARACVRAHACVCACMCVCVHGKAAKAKHKELNGGLFEVGGGGGGGVRGVNLLRFFYQPLRKSTLVQCTSLKKGTV